MSPREPSVVLLLSVLVFGGALLGLLRSPRREPRIAVLSGSLLGGAMLLLRAVFQPQLVILPATAAALQVASSLLSMLTLIMVVVAYREVRRSFRHPLGVSVVATVPGVALVCMLLAGVELARGFDLWSVLEMLPRDALLAALAFLAPPMLFELLWRTKLWGHLPTDRLAEPSER